MNCLKISVSKFLTICARKTLIFVAKFKELQERKYLHLKSCMLLWSSILPDSYVMLLVGVIFKVTVSIVFAPATRVKCEHSQIFLSASEWGYTHNGPSVCVYIRL
jgi:hypothetical protein